MKNKKIAVLAGIAIVGLALGELFAACSFSSPADLRSAQLLPEPKPLHPFTLEDYNGNLFTDKQLNQHTNLVFFGFTNCPDICPIEVQQLSKLLQLAAQHKSMRLQAIFISLDPERDTREKIRDYLAHFDAPIIGLRGTTAGLTYLNHFFSVDYSRIANSSSPVNGAENYQIEHSGRIFIVNGQGQYIGSFAPPHNVENMWADLQMTSK